MTTTLYEYRAVDARGRAQKGRVSAADRAQALKSVRSMGLTPVKITATRAGSGGGGGVKIAHLAQFTYELSVMLKAAIPIGDGLRAIAEQERRPAMRRVVERLAARIDAGDSIAGALREHQKVFGPVYIETIEAAERSGSLVRALEHLSESLEQQAETSRQVKQAVTYPAIVVGALVVGTLFLLVFVVPKFADMFRERGVELPLLTRALQAAGTSLRTYWWGYLLGAGGVVVAARQAWRSSAGRLTIDRALHFVPFVKRVLVSLAVSRFARVLAICLEAGVPLIDAVAQAGRASGRPALADQAERISRELRTGGRLSASVRRCAYLPVFAKRMLAAGEESAELPRMCRVVARHFDREAQHLTKNLGTLIEPVLIAALTAVVLIVALGIFLPMWDMASVMK